LVIPSSSGEWSALHFEKAVEPPVRLVAPMSGWRRLSPPYAASQ
jgi:hypothetical protein